MENIEKKESQIVEKGQSRQREKSPLYPAVTLQDCLDFMKQIDSLGGKSVSYASILNLMGLTSPSTKSFITRLSASKQYGLITTGGSTAQLTDIAKKILYPSDEKQATELLVESFSNPPLYSKLIERFLDKAIPPKEQLANILMNEYRIVKAVKDLAAKCFIESAEYLGVSVNGVLCFNSENSSSAPTEVIENETLQNQSLNEEEVLPELPSKKNVVGYNFEIATLSGKSAKIHFPSDVTEKDLDFIKLYIENMLPAFIENLREDLQKE